jgi:hypothetical protein
MTAFLDMAAFPGPAFRRNALGNPFVSQSRFNGHITFSNWPRTDVEKLLPPDLELCANISATPDVHPVVFIFGDQKQGAMMFGGFTFSLGVNYQELGMVIPFVRHKRGPYVHTYMARMYSSYAVATWNGNFHYGFSKEMARLWWQGPLYIVTTENDSLLLHASVEAGGKWSAGGSCTLPNFAAMQTIFALPVVGRKSNGAYICSYFGWDFDEALVRPADACVSIDAPLVDGLTPRECHDIVSGTVQVRGMLWKLSWPAACQFR